MGAEGPTDNPEINHARARQVRNILATLLLSQGVPMISGGDEIGRTQQGNNNAYCQDNEISWYDWTPTAEKELLLDFTSKLIELRRNHPNLRRRKFFQDRQIHNSTSRDIAWYSNDGNELDEGAWNVGWMRTLGMVLNGMTLNATNELGAPLEDDSFLLLLNAYHEAVDFALPPPPNQGEWKICMNTDAVENAFPGASADQKVKLEGRSTMLLVEKRPAKSSLP